MLKLENVVAATSEVRRDVVLVLGGKCGTRGLLSQV
jgi:hypothetical protein